MNAMRWPASVLMLLLTGAIPALGQEGPTVPGFSTVRLSSLEYTGVGTLMSVGPDSLELGIEGLAQSIMIPIPSVARLEYHRPATRRERATRGALWGAAVLGITGALIADRDEDTGPVEVALYSIVAGGLWGGAIGLLIPQSRWQPVEL